MVLISLETIFLFKGDKSEKALRALSTGMFLLFLIHSKQFFSRCMVRFVKKWACYCRENTAVSAVSRTESVMSRTVVRQTCVTEMSIPSRVGFVSFLVGKE